jgi:Spy/CpxP family protein refolding chaperone
MAAATSVCLIAADAQAPAAKRANDQNAAKRHRLPPYYAQVVKPEQRDKIYKIQDEYAPRIEELEQKLAALRQECEAAVRAVLTPKQQKLVDDLAAAAKENKAKQPDPPSEDKASPQR